MKRTCAACALRTAHPPAGFLADVAIFRARVPRKA